MSNRVITPEHAAKSNPALLPAPPEKKTVKMLSYTLVWCGMVINMGGFTMGAQFVPALSPYKFLLAIMVAYIFVCAIIALTSDIGLTYGVPWATYIRAPFGYFGAKLPTVTRLIPQFFWCGFQTWLGASALSTISDILFGMSNFYVFIVVLMALQVINAAFGMGAIAKFDWIAIPCLALLIGSVATYLLISNGVTIPEVFATPSTGGGNFWLAATSISGVWLTTALNGMDFARTLAHRPEHDSPSFFVRNSRIIIAVIIALLLFGASVLLTGMISGLLTGVWNPISMVTAAFQNNNVILILAMLTVIFAQWSTNIGAALLPAGFMWCNLFPKMNYKVGVILTGTIALVACPWLLAPHISTVTAVFAALMGPIGGIIISDYYLVRKRNLDLDILFDPTRNKVNYKALAVYIICTIASLLFTAYAFFVGFGLSLVAYFLVMRGSFNPDGTPKNT